jgi:hypothetical protein
VSDDRRAIERHLARISEVHGFASQPGYTLLDDPEQVAAKLLEYRQAGLDGFIASRSGGVAALTVHPPQRTVSLGETAPREVGCRRVDRTRGRSAGRSDAGSVG